MDVAKEAITLDYWGNKERMEKNGRRKCRRSGCIVAAVLLCLAFMGLTIAVVTQNEKCHQLLEDMRLAKAGLDRDSRGFLWFAQQYTSEEVREDAIVCRHGAWRRMPAERIDLDINCSLNENGSCPPSRVSHPRLSSAGFPVFLDLLDRNTMCDLTARLAELRGLWDISSGALQIAGDFAAWALYVDGRGQDKCSCDEKAIHKTRATRRLRERSLRMHVAWVKRDGSGPDDPFRWKKVPTGVLQTHQYGEIWFITAWVPKGPPVACKGTKSAVFDERRGVVHIQQRGLYLVNTRLFFVVYKTSKKKDLCVFRDIDGARKTHALTEAILFVLLKRESLPNGGIETLALDAKTPFDGVNVQDVFIFSLAATTVVYLERGDYLYVGMYEYMMRCLAYEPFTEFTVTKL